MPLVTGGVTTQGVDREDLRYSVVGYYSFALSGQIAAQGGAVSTINLVDEVGRGIVLPDNLVIERATIETMIALTSGGAATVALGTSEGGKSAVLLAATAYTDAQFATADLCKAGAAVATTPYKVTGTTIAPAITIAGAALTAGKLKIYLTGYLGD